MRLAAATLACAAAAAGACTATEPLPDAGPARALEVREDGYGVGYFRVVLRGDTLLVTRSGWAADWATTRVVAPSDAAWRAFWAEVRRAGVRGWPAECRDERVADGGGFSVALAWDGGTVRGAYTNSYPLPVGRCSGDPGRSAASARFLAAVRRLAGEP
jgi:hypothetical protein